MKYICKEKFEINGVLVGNKGDVLEITNATPTDCETSEDVKGYCDILNTTTNQLYNASWIDVEVIIETKIIDNRLLDKIHSAESRVATQDSVNEKNYKNDLAR